MRTDTRQRKHARAGLRALSGEQQRLGVLTRVLHSGKQALGALSLGSNQALALRSCSSCGYHSSRCSCDWPYAGRNDSVGLGYA
jgi:hypothetical protein